MPFDGVLAAIRLGLYADLALLMGLPLFWWTMGRRADGARPLTLAALAVGGALLSGLWLLASAAAMAGTPIAPPDWGTVHVLLTLTPLGGVLAVRALALLLILVLLVGRKTRTIALLPAAVAIATLAWSGHAGATEGTAGTVHRAADVLHIWAAAGWFGALAALLHAAFARHASAASVAGTAAMLDRFSLFGSIFVGTLVLTGAVNGVMIVGLAQLPALLGSSYGFLLGAKLALFGLMLGLAACNRWWLTPALAQAVQGGAIAPAIARLRLSLLVETSAAIAILALVAILGTLDPLA